jgi:hypothetical protein
LASAKTQVRGVIAVLSAAAGALLLISTSVSAQVANRVVGPTDPRTGFPVGLIDERGTSLAPCVDDIVLCPSTLPNLALPPAVPGNFPDEFFYSFATADLNIPGSSVALLEVAVEGSFVNAPLVQAGQQTLFGRVRVRIKGGLTVGATYRITHPYGVLNATAINVGGVGTINQTEDIGCLAPVPGIICPPFTPVTTSTPWPFLVWNPAVAPAAPAGYIGAPAILHTVVGSPTGNNLFSIQGPGGLNAQTTLFSVAGKRIDFTPPKATVTSPLAGATVRGTVPVTATATDNVGVTSLQIQLDDINLGLASASSPLTVSWNTTQSTAGTHRLTAIARDLAGNVGTSAVVLVTVNNAAAPPPPPPPPGPLVSVPDVVGRPLADAQSRIAAVHLTSTVTSAHSANAKVGEVISQSPGRNTLVPSGSNVALVVSLGP